MFCGLFGSAVETNELALQGALKIGPAHYSLAELRSKTQGHFVSQPPAPMGSTEIVNIHYRKKWVT